MNKESGVGEAQSASVLEKHSEITSSVVLKCIFHRIPGQTESYLET